MGMLREVEGTVGYGLYAITAVFVGASMFLLLDQFGERMINAVRDRV